MPTGKTISTITADVFLAGDRVRDERRGFGTIVVPPHAAFAAMEDDTDVYVAWDDHPAGWTHRGGLERVQSAFTELQAAADKQRGLK